ncbi:MAG: DUF4230 domain-containing protein [Bacteroidetes bacterium SW_9_63_38]|nr:MAG: DUF4230 domain-containing protein [Bacteroidetes bacterium SW_9_63_38]
MALRTRTVFGIGAIVGVVLAAAVGLWWVQQPTATVRRTVLTTVQEEAPASFLVTGTLDLHATVRIDSSAYATPDWLTVVLSQAQPSVLSYLEGRARTEVAVPGRVSYGFDVRALTPEMIQVADDGVVEVDVPPLDIHSIEPSLSKLRVQSSTEGWMRVFASEVPAAVRRRAISEVREALRKQAQARLDSAAQPRVNTARALKKMLASPLTAAGLDEPRFRIRVGEHLSLTPEATERETFRTN